MSRAIRAAASLLPVRSPNESRFDLKQSCIAQCGDFLPVPLIGLKMRSAQYLESVFPKDCLDSLGNCLVILLFIYDLSSNASDLLTCIAKLL